MRTKWKAERGKYGISLYKWEPCKWPFKCLGRWKYEEFFIRLKDAEEYTKNYTENTLEWETTK